MISCIVCLDYYHIEHLNLETDEVNNYLFSKILFKIIWNILQ